MSRGRAWNDALQGADTCECKDFSCFGLCPTWMRAGIVGSLSCSITTLIWGCSAGFAVRSTGKEGILHPSPSTQGFASSVAAIPPSSPAGSLGICDFPHARSSKLPGERCCSGLRQGRAHLLSAECRVMGNSAPGLLFHLESISHAGSAAGWWGWEASSLLLLLVGIFFFFTAGFEVCSLLKRGNGFVRRWWLSCLLEGDREQQGSNPPFLQGSGSCFSLGKGCLSWRQQGAVGWGTHQNMSRAGFAFSPLLCPIPFLPASLGAVELLVPSPKLQTVHGPLQPTWDPSVCRRMWLDGL